MCAVFSAGRAGHWSLSRGGLARGTVLHQERGRSWTLLYYASQQLARNQLQGEAGNTSYVLSLFI